jgi:CheY-like chemotaxis protein
LAEVKSKPKLLIVEDDKENQKFLNIFLRKIYILDFCDSDESFYTKLSENTYDIILMDITLQGAKDGLQLTQELRRNPQYSNMPIVGLSAHAYQKDINKAYEAGVDIFITKPVQGTTLLESLTSALEKRAAYRKD